MNALRVDRTPYDDFLDILLSLISGLAPAKRASMARLWDSWRTDAAYGILNAPYSADRQDPNDSSHKYSPRLASDASEVIAWRVESGSRPEWLHSITDAELAAL